MKTAQNPSVQDARQRKQANKANPSKTLLRHPSTRIPEPMHPDARRDPPSLATQSSRSADQMQGVWRERDGAKREKQAKRSRTRTEQSSKKSLSQVVKRGRSSASVCSHVTLGVRMCLSVRVLYISTLSPPPLILASALSSHITVHLYFCCFPSHRLPPFKMRQGNEGKKANLTCVDRLSLTC